ncbi:MAG: GAF domain-containing protein [Actinomycetota bacterium]
MSATARSTVDLLSDAVRGVASATTIEDALRALARVLQEDFALWRVSVIRFPTGSRHIEIVAAWSANEIILVPGNRIAIDLTPATRQLSETLQSGRPAMFRSDSIDLGLLNDLMRDEGVASWLGLPLFGCDQVVAVLSLSSSNPDAFGEADILFFKGLAAGIQKQLISLLPVDTDITP